MRTKTSLLKLTVIGLLLICLWSGLTQVLVAESSSGKQTTAPKGDPNNYNPSANLMEQSHPKIDNIKFQPPVANQPCRVQVRVTEVRDNTKANLTAVKLIYYVNGRLDKPREVKMKGSLGNLYTASIPGMASGTRVNFIIRAEDSNGNVATQAVPSSKNLIPGIAALDDPPEAAPDSLDLLGISAGYDQKSIYVQANLQGKISGGTTDPLFIHVYGAKFSNPDQDPKEGQFVGKGVFHLPLIKGSAWTEQDGNSYWMKLVGGKEKLLKVKKTGTVFADIPQALAQNTKLAFPEVAFESQVNGPVLTVKVARAALGANPSGYLRIIGITWINKSTSAVFPIIKDCSNFLILYTSSQSYTVK